MTDRWTMFLPVLSWIVVACGSQALPGSEGSNPSGTQPAPDSAEGNGDLRDGEGPDAGAAGAAGIGSEPQCTSGADAFTLEIDGQSLSLQIEKLDTFDHESPTQLTVCGEMFYLLVTACDGEGRCFEGGCDDRTVCQGVFSAGDEERLLSFELLHRCGPAIGETHTWIDATLVGLLSSVQIGGRLRVNVPSLACAQ